ncbi:hypothetical protein BSL78_13909 [Apostichopus japonicus]|uniref:Uncharacterized protein n=1 Tax=Stichopus japonicus TaxID=307972 RepID=A0A2G8KMI1_STIJA|nr:hypothetical protein BSL78_13909 [Apostichopus japonicus]
MADRIYPKLSTRNIEAETLHEIQSRRSQREANLLNGINSRKSISGLSSASSINNNQTVSQKFWRDFGPLEVTTCVANDGKQVVMVYLEGRVCINGEPIRVLPNGKILLSNGKTDTQYQYYFDCAMKARNQMKHAGDASQGITRTSVLNPTQRLHDTVCELNSSVAHLAERYIHLSSKPRRIFCKRKQNAYVHSDLTSLVSLLNTLNDETDVVSRNHDDIHSKLYDNERALVALVKAVKCFSSEAILSEPGKYTSAVYKDMYAKYNELATREQEMTEELQKLRSQNETLDIDKSTLERQLQERISQCDEQMLEINTLRNKNRLLSLSHTKSVSQSLDLENQSSILEKQLEQLQDKSKKERSHSKDISEKLRYLQKRLHKVTMEKEKLSDDHRKTTEDVHKLSLRSRQQTKSITALQEDRRKVERDRDRLIKLVRGALQDKQNMTSCLSNFDESKSRLRLK